jgi:hypothetical protein
MAPAFRTEGGIIGGGCIHSTRVTVLYKCAHHTIAWFVGKVSIEQLM